MQIICQKYFTSVLWYIFGNISQLNFNLTSNTYEFNFIWDIMIDLHRLICSWVHILTYSGPILSNLLLKELTSYILRHVVRFSERKCLGYIICSLFRLFFFYCNDFSCPIGTLYSFGFYWCKLLLKFGCWNSLFYL